jgi:hypothetical protein
VSTGLPGDAMELLVGVDVLLMAQSQASLR